MKFHFKLQKLLEKFILENPSQPKEGHYIKLFPKNFYSDSERPETIKIQEIESFGDGTFKLLSPLPAPLHCSHLATSLVPRPTALMRV